jgi:hypothetical protein
MMLNMLMLVLQTALRMPLREAACPTGNKLSNVSCATMCRAKEADFITFLQSGIKTRCV